MTPNRYKKLMTDEMSELSDEELKQGWHFCYDWDGLLVGPGMQELDFCTCGKKHIEQTWENEKFDTQRDSTQRQCKNDISRRSLHKKRSTNKRSSPPVTGITRRRHRKLSW